jgi:CubicO group peptidase (beta-lactamase class C family)
MSSRPRSGYHHVVRIAPSTSTQLDFSGIVSQVQRWVEQGFYPGASLVIGRRQQIIFEQYFGVHDAETEEFIASAGKWLASAAIAAVVDRGMLSWDDPVSKWLPELAGGAGTATLRHLLSHTSGFPAQPPSGLNDTHQTLEASVAQIVGWPLLEAPGERFCYGGLSMQVAGRMAELATGESFDQIFERLLARPLGLKHTRFTPVDAGPGHSPMLAGGARSTARDYARFLAMLAGSGEFDGEQVLSQLAILEMQHDQVGDAAVGPGEFVERARGAKHKGVYGLGQWRERVDHEGRALQVSSPSWAGTYPWIDIERGVYGVLLAHVDLSGPHWDGGFNPYYSSAVIAELAGTAVDRVPA